MAFLATENVTICGISACVPKNIEENLALPVFASNDDAVKFITSTGIERRHIADDSICTSDLCYNAAEKLISELKWEKSDIDCLIFVTQTPDYILPATSCILQDRLGLNKECYTLDISLGCSGWVYGMSVITSLMSSGYYKKGLLLAGDVLSKINSRKDKSSYPLFGDAGTATALQYSRDINPFKFHFSTDGSGYKAIIIPDGGIRNKVSDISLINKQEEDGIIRTPLDIILNGMDVFTFGISKAPKSVNSLFEKFGIDRDEVDYYLFHQANKFMNEKIRKKLKLTEEQVPYSLKDFGNTSSATIPLTMVTQLQKELVTDKLNLVGCGFGVGLSWGSINFSTDKICVPDLIEI
ncbi:MAG: ketoacyl-ACP synthase III [Muribaculaceae bacterium]